MGAYAYCKKCDNAMPQPKLSEALMEQQLCKTCGCPKELDTYEPVAAAKDLEDRLESVEGLLGRMQKRLEELDRRTDPHRD